MKILVTLTFVQMMSRMSCNPLEPYVISSYSNVRLQQPTNGLSVESQMPMEIMMNPILADEQPTVDKMEDIFVKSDQMKNLKTINLDEKQIMESINKLNADDTIENTSIYDEADFIAMGTELPAGFSVTSESTVQTTD